MFNGCLNNFYLVSHTPTQIVRNAHCLMHTWPIWSVPSPWQYERLKYTNVTNAHRYLNMKPNKDPSNVALDCIQCFLLSTYLLTNGEMCALYTSFRVLCFIILHSFWNSPKRKMIRWRNETCPMRSTGNHHTVEKYLSITHMRGNHFPSFGPLLSHSNSMQNQLSLRFANTYTSEKGIVIGKHVCVCVCPYVKRSFVVRWELRILFFPPFLLQLIYRSEVSALSIWC